ncbi:hypothetical protein QJS04_geneDACA005212 [Acorus gramineus]|uniref:Uncharacterized protein n=1 Tax=Acorus gramineus TaxID=55184 RepID=A0AAV9AV93_ACOGR|nr:hypothetical protein QJS04_geneDACA005212 [Acorus gramineus]
MHRWSSIHLAVVKFHGYFMQIEARQQSGVNEQDKVKEEKKVWMQEEAEQLERLYAQEREMIVIKREKLRLKEMIEEERIMAIDTTKMQSLQAEYYKALQMKIMRKIVQL